MQTDEVARAYPLPDGRVVIASIFDETGGDTPGLGPLWKLQIQGSDDLVGIGHPLDSNLAELLGYNVAHDDWPKWIGELAALIEADARGNSSAGRSSGDIS